MSMTREEAEELIAKYHAEVRKKFSASGMNNVPEVYALLLAALTAPDPRVAELQADLERERMRLAACGVAALANTPDTVVKRITKDHPYWSVSYCQVCDAVDREMNLRLEVERLDDELEKDVAGWKRNANLAIDNAQKYGNRMAMAEAEVERLKRELEASVNKCQTCPLNGD